MQHIKMVFVTLAILLLIPACPERATYGPVEAPRAGFGNMGLSNRRQEPPCSAPRCSTVVRARAIRATGALRSVPCGEAGGRSKSSSPITSCSGGAASQSPTGPVGVAGGGSVEMEMYEDYFEPSVLRGAPGTTVTIELHNEGTRPHNFSLPAQDIDLQCGVRARDEVEVTFPRSGLLLFSCKYTGHFGHARRPRSRGLTSRLEPMIPDRFSPWCP